MKPLLLFLLFTCTLQAQVLKPGFDKQECLNMLVLSAHHGDSALFGKLPRPGKFKPVYRAKEVGLQFCWDLWTSEDHIAVINVRGSTKDKESWYANFYSAMVPAKGALKLSKSHTFQYDLASNPKAAVHTGYLLSVAYLSSDILSKIDSLYKSGIKDFIVSGHSQGGGVAYILTAYLYAQQKQKTLPSDIRFKTYCTAAPKPGNLYFAYDYETMTQEGWAYNIVNTADWVPEVPFSVQTIYDFTDINPFTHAKKILKKLPFPQDVIVVHVYNAMRKHPVKADKKYIRYLGHVLYKTIKKELPEFEEPQYVSSCDYVRTGRTIVLKADEAYYERFPDNPQNVFCHHFFYPYYFLLEKLPEIH